MSLLPRVDVTVGEQGEDALRTALLHVQRLIFQHPAAALAAAQAVVAEGRRFAATPEGSAWMARLQGSELIRRGRLVWEAATLNALEEPPPAVLPSKLLELLARLASHDRMEQVLAAVSEREVGP